MLDEKLIKYLWIKISHPQWRAVEQRLNSPTKAEQKFPKLSKNNRQNSNGGSCLEKIAEKQRLISYSIVLRTFRDYVQKF